MSEKIPKPERKRRTPEAGSYKPSAKVAQSREFKDFKTAMYKERDKLIKELTKAAENKFNKGSDKLDPRARKEYEDILRKQYLAIHYFIKDKINEYARSIENKDTGLSALAAKLKGEAVKKAKTRVDGIKTILKDKVEGKDITNRDVLEIATAIQTLETMETMHPELPALMQRVVDGNSLTEDENQKIISLLNPQDMTGKAREGVDASDPIKLYEATAAGAFLAAMDDSQRVDFTRTFLTTEKDPQKRVAYLESMLSMGFFNKVNGENILNEAKELDPNNRQKYNDMIKKLNNDYYQKEAQRYEEQIQKELKKFYKGRYAKDLSSRMAGKPFWGFLGMAVGGATLALNTMVAKGNPAMFLKNPYWYAGLAATVFGTEAFFGSLKKGVMIGAGPVADVARRFGDTDEKKEHLRINNDEFERIYTNGPTEVRKYLDKGGFATIMALREEIKKDKNRTKEITVKDLLEMEQSGKEGANKERRRLLEAMNTSVDDKNRKCTAALTRLSNLAVILKIKNQADMKKKLYEINQKQKGKNKQA